MVWQQCQQQAQHHPRPLHPCPPLVGPMDWLDCWSQQSDASSPTGGLIARIVGIGGSAINPSNEARRDCWSIASLTNDQSRSCPAMRCELATARRVRAGNRLAIASRGHVDLLSSQLLARRAVCATVGVTVDVTVGVTIGVAADSDIMIVLLVGRARCYRPASPPASTASLLT